VLLSEKVALITGAAGGIGRAISLRFAGEGAAVGVCDLDLPRAEAVAEEVRSAGGRAFAYRLDAAEESEVQAFFPRFREEHGRLDILVNNAGIGINKPVTQLHREEWDRVIGVNLTGSFLCAKHAAPLLKRSRGAIVNIASTRAVMSEPNTEAYSASKGGIVALTHALAVSLGPAVRVNCILPGWINVTEWKKSALRKSARLSSQDHAQHPAGRVGRPEDIAALAAFLISPEAGFITGGAFVVDGGMTRKMIYVE